MEKNLLPTPEQVRIAKQEKEKERIEAWVCPKCADTLHSIEGCKKCMSCGWSGCNN